MAQQEGSEPETTAKSLGKSSTPERSVDQMVHQRKRVFNFYQINSNLGPVVGVYREEGDFLDQDERFFSNDANITAQINRNFLFESFASTGILAAAKHFPI